MERRRSALLNWLERSLDVCQESMSLTQAIEDTQSDLGMEIAGLKEFLSDLDGVERRVREHVSDIRSRIGRYVDAGTGTV